MTIWHPGHRIAGGRYVVERLLGEGGFCCTYQGRDRDGRPVAIKTLNAARSQSQRLNQWQESLANEALRLAKCHHRHVVSVEEFVLDGLRWCVVLEYLPGDSLDAIVERDGPMPIALVIALVQQLGAAIAHLHDRALLHRDIKPLNVLTRANGEAVLIDFGLACSFEQDAVAVLPDYATRGFAPLEQYDIHAKRGAYSDVYGLAATFYFLLTAEVPRSPRTRQRHLLDGDGDPLIPPVQYCPALGDRLQGGILSGLALQPEHRPPTVGAWFEQLGIEMLAPGAGDRAAPLAAGAVAAADGAPDTDAYASAIGLRFNTLRSHLAAKDWQAADRETDRLLQTAAGITPGRAIAIDDIDKIPSRDLRTIVTLWDEHSHGRFGLGHQARLWHSLGRDNARFAAAVGWSRRGQWLGYGELSFHDEAPAGHLPTWGRRGKLWAALCERLEHCSIVEGSSS